MPKLLQINSVVNTGSTGRIAEQIGICAIDNGWESFIAFGRSAGPSASRLIKIGNKYDQILHGVHTRLFDRHGLASTGQTKKLISQIEALQPDIIHLHNIHGYYLNYKTFFGFLAQQKAPVVWTLHDCWAFTGHCSYFSSINCIKWKTHCNKCPKTKNYPASFLLDNSYDNYKRKKEVFNKISNLTIVSVSRWLDTLVEQSFLSNHQRLVIHNGVDLKEFYPIENTEQIEDRYDLKGRKVLVAVASSWSKSKGWDDYIKLSGMLPADCTLIMVGLSKHQKQNLPSNIVGIEKTNSVHELAALYSRADVLLNLSYQETFGMTTIEGFACGTPAIVYNATASPELVTKETGYIVEPGDIKGVLAAVVEIMEKGKQYFANKCRQLAIEHYNKETRWLNYLKLYNRLMKN